MSAPATHRLALAPRPVVRRDWRDDAACRTADPELFFPLPGADHSPARAYCGACPVRAECLQDALNTGDGGVRGGLSEDARLQLRRAARTAPVEPVEPVEREQPDDLAVPSALVVVDELDEQLHATIAVHPGVAELVDRTTVRGLVEGRGPQWASRWEVALAAVVLLARGLTATAVARFLGEEYVQVKRWRDRAETGEPLVAGERGTVQLRRPARLVGPQVPAAARPGREARTWGAA